MSAPVLIAAFAATIPAAALGWLAAASLARLFPARRLHDRFWRLARWMALVPPAAVLLAPLAARIPMPGPAASGTAETASAAPVLPILFEIELQPVMSAAGSAAPDLPWVCIIAGVWLAGLALCAARMAGRRLTMVRLLRAGTEPSPRLRARFEIIAAEAGVPVTRVRLRVIDAEVSPFVTGLRPVIALPASMAGPDAAERAGFALAHELAHVRRGDERDRIAGELLGAVLWFNPVLALIESRLALAREFACDAEALDRLPPAARRPYGRALIASGARPMPALAGAAFLPSHRRIFEMRIQSILRPGPVRTRTALAAGAAAFAVLAAPLAMAQVWTSSALAARAGHSEPSAEGQAAIQQTFAIYEEHGAQAQIDALTALIVGGELSPAGLAAAHNLKAGRYSELDDPASSRASHQAAIDTGALSDEEVEAVRSLIASSYMSEGRLDEGVSVLERIVAGTDAPSDQIYEMLAWGYAQQGRAEDAARIRVEMESGEGQTAQVQTGQFSAEAGERFQRALALNDAEDYDAAMTELDGMIAMELAPHEEAMAQRLAASIHFQRGDLESAITAFRAALDAGGMTEDEVGSIRLNMGQLMIATEDVSGGLAEIEAVIDGPEDASRSLARLMAQAYAVEERWAEALPYQERYMAQLDAPSALDHQLSENIYANLGMEAERAEAEARRRALEADPD